MHPAACTAAGEGTVRLPHPELADIFRLYGEDYRAAHALPAAHLRVIHDIVSCRTAALGGHLERCSSCGFERPAYDSCRNRHCPKCQTFAKEKWLSARRAELLPVPYFHVVFTLPHELNTLVLGNLRPLVDLLFQAASQTLLTFGRNELRGALGFLAILHTWDQLLRAHFHLHCLVPGGALAFDRSSWTPANEEFLFPVFALGKVFRGKFLEGLKSAHREATLRFPGAAAPLASQEGFAELLGRLYRKSWIVYAKPPFAGPERVLDYLARYTHRVAISNDRILELNEGQVRFAYRDRRHGDRVRTMSLPAEEFIGRFLLHVLPKGLMRIRHYGFLANRGKADALARCRALLGTPAPSPATPSAPIDRALLLAALGIDPARCPRCHQPTLSRIAQIAPMRTHLGALSPVPPDTS